MSVSLANCKDGAEGFGLCHICLRKSVLFRTVRMGELLNYPKINLYCFFMSFFGNLICIVSSVSTLFAISVVQRILQKPLFKVWHKGKIASFNKAATAGVCIMSTERFWWIVWNQYVLKFTQSLCSHSSIWNGLWVCSKWHMLSLGHCYHFKLREFIGPSLKFQNENGKQWNYKWQTCSENIEQHSQKPLALCFPG